MDADLADAVTEDNLDETIKKLKAFSKVTGSVIAVTGAIDLVADAEKCYVIRNGRPEMGAITGTGCQLSGMMTAFLCANIEQPLEAAAAAAVSYTHLDVYKRQDRRLCERKSHSCPGGRESAYLKTDR